MDNNQLIVALVASLAWPVTALLLALLLRPVFRDLLTRLRTLKYGGVEASLEDLDRLSGGSAAGQVSAAEGALQPKGLDASLAKLVETSPAATLETAWRRVRDAVMKAAYMVTSEQRLGWTESVEELLRAKVLTSRDLSILTVLSTIRQSVYYDGTAVSPAAVLDFIAQADRIAAHVESATEPPPPED